MLEYLLHTFTNVFCYNCPRHPQAPRVRVTRSQPGELLKPFRSGLLWRLLERALLLRNVAVCGDHIYKCFLSVLWEKPWREVLRRGAVLSSICEASWPSPTTTLDRKRTWKRRNHVWWVERVVRLLPSFFFSFFLVLFVCWWGVCVCVWEWMCEWMSLECYSCA